MCHSPWRLPPILVKYQRVGRGRSVQPLIVQNALPTRYQQREASVLTMAARALGPACYHDP